MIELLIVVAVILILCAAAAVHIRHARIAANQASAVASMRTINTSQAIYLSSFPQTGYAGSLSWLGNNGSDCQSVSNTNSCILNSELAGGAKNGYLFDLVGDGQVPDASYQLTGSPEAKGLTGNCTYYSSQSGSITTTNGAVGKLSMYKDDACPAP